MLYELALLTLRIGATPQALAHIKAYVEDGAAKGTLVGCFASEIGELNKVAVLRSFTDAEALRTERHRALESADPFGCKGLLTHIELDGYAPFPGIPAIETGAFGPIYEIRTYTLKPGGLPPTIATWEKALPGRRKLSRNVIVMHTVDGPPRFTHIWSYASLEQRAAVRGKAVAEGIWPPPGGADHLAVMRNGIWLPTAISPLT